VRIKRMQPGLIAFWPVLLWDDGFDGCKNITMIFFRSRMLVDEAQAH
jgi:hypothetical protein